MPKKTAAKPKRETWRDWQAEDAPPTGQLIDRDELVQVFESEGIDATENDLLYWQRLGVIPYPVLRRVGRTGHASYPFWMVELVRTLRQMQAEGHSLDEIRVHLRDLARKVSVMEQWRPSWTKPYLSLQLNRLAVNIARTYKDATGDEVRRVDIHIYPQTGERYGRGFNLDGSQFALRDEPYTEDD
jgi:DNA-binding transcriptional MerR regulator